MKHLILCLLFCGLLFGVPSNVQAQKKAAKSSKSSKKKKKTEEATPAVVLPYNSNDCLFAIDLKLDSTFGPTSAPQGAGRIMEVTSSPTNRNVVDHEHNSVWYKFTVPYNGLMEIDIAQLDYKDDYDFMVYRYTNSYFSNNLIQGNILPVASNLSQVDTNLPKKLAAAEAAAKANAGAAKGAAAAAKPAAKKKTGKASNQLIRTIGMKHDASNFFISKADTSANCKSLYVSAGETYYILLDNHNSRGGGHTIKVSLFVDAFNPVVQFIDPQTKKPTDVDLVVVEKNTGNKTIAQNAAFKGGRIKFVPGYDYTLYAKKPGYFTIYREFNGNYFKQDTMLSLPLFKASKGSTFSVENIYFDSEGNELVAPSDSVLSTFVQLFTSQPDVTFLIKGYVPTYGEVTMESDLEVSLARAVTVKKYFISKGIAAERMTVAGMTPAEIKKAGAAADDPKIGLLKKRVDFVITSGAKGSTKKKK